MARKISKNEERGVTMTYLHIPVIKRLASMKRFRESYSDVIECLLNFYDKNQGE